MTHIPLPRHGRAALGALALAAAVLSAACTTPAPAPRPEPPTCPDDATIAAQVAGYLARQPVANPPATLTMAGAACGARKYVAALQAQGHLGPVIGYKAGLTNPAVQQRFKVDHPLRGTLLARMMLGDGETVSAAFGARPFFEPDLVVEVGSSAIHAARTPLEVLAALRNVRPFIELPDTLVQEPAKLNGPALVALNVGARLGVLGAKIALQPTPAWADALRLMTVRAVDDTGRELARAPGSAILGDPLQAVIWLADALQREGITLQPGDLLSLGAFGSGGIQVGRTVTVHYDGLPGNPSVSVSFK